ncbi:hypothetical protein AB1287_10320 [Enterobacter asburiae]|uniref:hypothetical protein n=1 Tax=Scandinavium sp. UTDF21-P1B TaxID=3446379 RepID=UPI00346D17BE
MEWTNEQLIETARVVSKYESEKAAQLLNQLATRFECALLAARTACDEKRALAAENVGLKSKLMFWDAENPEAPYDSPEELASELLLNYHEEFEVQVAARLPNRTYRVCESWEEGGKLELVEGTEIETPATDRFVGEMKAQYRAEGINYAAGRLAAAFNHGFLNKPLKEVGDVCRMILDAKDDLERDPIPAPDGLSGEYAEKSLKDWEEQLREAGQ